MTTTKTSGWVVYAGIMLVVSGAGALIDSIWAFRYDDAFEEQLEAYPLLNWYLVFFEDNLTAWAWMWLALAVLLFAAGLGVFSGATWAKWTGIVAGSIAIVSNLSWAQIQPTQGLIGALLAALVIYGLAAHADEVA